MNKDEIIAKLEEEGISHDPKLRKEDLLALLPDGDDEPKSKPEETKSKYVAVRRLAEAGEVYKPGASILLTKARASALGKLVRPSSD